MTTMPFATTLSKIRSIKLLAATLLLFAGAAVMSTNDELTVRGSLRRLQAKATSTLRRLAALDNYTLVSENHVFDGAMINYDTSFSLEECAASCDATTGCETFDYRAVDGSCVLFSDVYDPSTASPAPGYNIYSKSSASAQGDPLFTGFRGQVLKFEGKDAAWYANVASPSLQWNLNFRKVSVFTVHYYVA